MKKWIILAVIALISIAGFFIYRAVFASNTAFNEKEVVIYIPTGADFGDVLHKLRQESTSSRKGQATLKWYVLFAIEIPL